MSFSVRERTLHLIQSEIDKIKLNLLKKPSKKELKDKEGYFNLVNENIIELQKNIFEVNRQQLEQIDNIYNYLESNYNQNKEGVIFQQKKLEKLRSKLGEETKKYLHNI